MHSARPASSSSTRTGRRGPLAIPLLIVPLTLLAALFLLLLALVAARWSPLMTLDTDIVRSLHTEAVDAPDVTHVHRVLSDWVWDPWTMRLVCAAVVAVLAWRLRDRVLAAWVAATCLVGTLLQQALKAAVDRPRPVWPDPVDSAHYAAFPSGHAMTAAVVCGLVLWLLRRHGAGRALWRTALAVSVVSVLGVGLTRLWLGVHWPSDVVGGWLLGALTVVASATAYEKWWASPSRP
ncbi:phosphatase PAP2 family protein [Streptomyces sp. SID8379]|uniref:phosphatase PAP2 family protein n=1 Tax=unclassified Streptomyces TaxID=2593676 RepID=UPI00039D1014|nr:MULTISPECIES: phosphatase PAP2 family protein [unclassified Streptomyces]MYW63061.1 phosphatase PAP2 family protein [Streptomyces sp. SID8379]